MSTMTLRSPGVPSREQVLCPAEPVFRETFLSRLQDPQEVMALRGLGEMLSAYVCATHQFGPEETMPAWVIDLRPAALDLRSLAAYFEQVAALLRRSACPPLDGLSARRRARTLAWLSRRALKLAEDLEAELAISASSSTDPATIQPCQVAIEPKDRS